MHDVFVKVHGRDEEVAVAVAVAVDEKSHVAALARFGHAGLGSDVAEVVPVVAVEMVGGGHVNGVEVAVAVVVVVATGHAEGFAAVVHAGLRAAVGKGAVPLIVVETIGPPAAGDARGHVQIRQAIVVVVGPDSYEAVVCASDSGLGRDIAKGAIALIAVERVGREALPSLASGKEVWAAVAIVVCGNGRPAAARVCEVGGGRYVGKAAVAIVAVECVRGLDAGGEEVRVAVGVVVEPRHAAPPIALADAGCCGHIGKAHRRRLGQRCQADLMGRFEVAWVGAIRLDIGQSQVPLAHGALWRRRGQDVNGALVRGDGLGVLAQVVVGRAQQEG